MKPGMNNLLKQAQKLQADMQRTQAELANTELEGSAANGLVRIQMNGKYEVKRVHLDETVLSDKETLEDLLLLAFRDAFQKIETLSSTRLSGIVPSGVKLPF